MKTWFTYLKQGISRTLPDDRIAGQQGYAGMRANLRNLQPFVIRHWRKGLLGALLILFTSLIGLPQPLITRYLIDDVILNRQLGLLAGAVLLLAGIKGLGMLTGLLQQFYCTRFEQEILFDIQHALLDRTLRFPKSFFDDKEVGYLMSRLLSDVRGLRWFFSSTLVYVISNILRFVGGAALLFYLEWKLALVALVIIPGLVLIVHYFSHKLRVLSHQDMERHANVSRRMQESLSAASLIKAFVSEQREVDHMMSAWRAAFRTGLEWVTVN